MSSLAMDGKAAENHAQSANDLPRGREQGRSRSLLRDVAYAAIKKRIFSGVYAPGDCLLEPELKAELGMSNTPIKSALHRLEYEGFVTVAPHRGVVVRTLSTAEVVDLFGMRLCLESYTYAQVAGNLNEEQTQQLQSKLDEYEATLQSPDVRSRRQLDAEFHLLICGFTGNRELYRELQRVCEQMFPQFVHLSLDTRHRRAAENIQDHRRIADAVIAGDAGLATKHLEEHLKWGKRTLMAIR